MFACVDKMGVDGCARSRERLRSEPGDVTYEAGIGGTLGTE